MKTRSVLLSGILLATAIPAFAQNTSGMQGMKMDQNMPGMNHTIKTAQGVGMIEAIDTAKDTVRIKHQPIASIGWPAMNMEFKADPPSMLRSIKVGERVHFTLRMVGMNAIVIAIAPANA